MVSDFQTRTLCILEADLAILREAIGSVSVPSSSCQICENHVNSLLQAGGRKHGHFVDRYLFGVAGRAQRSALNEWSDPQGQWMPVAPLHKWHAAPSGTTQHQAAPRSIHSFGPDQCSTGRPGANDSGGCTNVWKNGVTVTSLVVQV